MEESMIDFSIRSYTHIVLLYTTKILITHTPHTSTHTPHTHTPTPPTHTHTHAHTHAHPHPQEQGRLVSSWWSYTFKCMRCTHKNTICLIDFKSVTWPHTNFGMTSIHFFVMRCKIAYVIFQLLVYTIHCFLTYMYAVNLLAY